MTADIRTAARAQALRFNYVLTNFGGKPILNDVGDGFVQGAEWAVALVTPTREQVKAAATKAWDDWWAHDDGKSYQDAMADSLLALMQGLAEGEASA